MSKENIILDNGMIHVDILLRLHSLFLKKLHRHQVDIIYCSGSRDAVTPNDTTRHVLNACLTLLLKSKIIQNIDRGGDLVYIVRS